MRLCREGIIRFDQLNVPCQSNRSGGGMFRKPTIIVPAALPKALPGRGKSDQRDEQDIGCKGPGARIRLHEIERTADQIAVAERVGVFGEIHRLGFRCKARQGQRVPVLLKVTCITRCRCFVWCRMIQADDSMRRDMFKDRAGWPQKQQCPDVIRLRSNMLLAGFAQRLS